MIRDLPNVGDTLNGLYRIERLVDKDGIAAVYEASVLGRPRRCALKVLLPEHADAAEMQVFLHREAHTTARIDHPHVLEAFDFGLAEEGRHFLTIELLDGESLAARLTRERRLTVPAVTSILGQTAAALQAAHEQGIVHGSLTPRKIILCRRDRRDDFVKVLGFGRGGMACAASAIPGCRGTVGTPLYLSPEQVEPPVRDADARTDVYAMGAIAFEALSGRPPLSADSTLQLLYKIAYEDPPPLCTIRADLPAALERVIGRALAKQPERRFDSMTAFWGALQAAAA